jgi:hypothetical protein
MLNRPAAVILAVQNCLSKQVIFRQRGKSFLTLSKEPEHQLVFSYIRGCHEERTIPAFSKEWPGLVMSAYV